MWNWRALTVRAVATRAAVNQRTVYRHFPSERALRDAVFARLQDEAGVEVEHLRLDDLQAVTARILEYVSTFPHARRSPLDPTLAEAAARNRAALLDAVRPHADGWSEPDTTLAAAMLDVQWGVASYERLVADWGAAPEDAIRAVTWVQGLIEDAIRDGRRPSARPTGGSDTRSTA